MPLLLIRRALPSFDTPGIRLTNRKGAVGRLDQLEIEPLLETRLRELFLEVRHRQFVEVRPFLSSFLGGNFGLTVSLEACNLFGSHFWELCHAACKFARFIGTPLRLRPAPTVDILIAAHSNS